MIDVFRMSPKVIPYIHEPMDLMDQIAAVTNSYTEEYLKSLKRPKVDYEKFDNGLLPILNKLLDKRIKKPLRNFVIVSIYRDDEDDRSMVEIDWDRTQSNFVIPKGPSKDGKIVFH